MFWIALEVSIPKIRIKIMLSLTVKKLDAFKFDGVAESDNTGTACQTNEQTFLFNLAPLFRHNFVSICSYL